jgi:hypothetical protein
VWAHCSSRAASSQGWQVARLLAASGRDGRDERAARRGPRESEHFVGLDLAAGEGADDLRVEANQAPDAQAWEQAGLGSLLDPGAADFQEWAASLASQSSPACSEAASLAFVMADLRVRKAVRRGRM